MVLSEEAIGMEGVTEEAIGMEMLVVVVVDASATVSGQLIVCQSCATNVEKKNHRTIHCTKN